MSEHPLAGDGAPCSPHQMMRRIARTLRARVLGRIARDAPGRGMTCQQLVELVTDYFDGVLADDLRVAFEEHLSLCSGCAFYLEQMRITIGLAHDSRELEQRPEVTALLAEFRNWKTRP